MSILNHLAQAAAVLLLIELLVVIVVFLAVAGGLAFGLKWARGKTSWATGKADRYSGLGKAYTEKSLAFVVKPLISTAALVESLMATLRAMQREVGIVREAIQRRRSEVVVPATPPPRLFTASTEQATAEVPTISEVSTEVVSASASPTGASRSVEQAT